jgi:hypothetical protein
VQGPEGPNPSHIAHTRSGATAAMQCRDTRESKSRSVLSSLGRTSVWKSSGASM